MTDSKKHAPKSSREMIRAICNEVHSGHGFVPFIGSGVSAPSGILTGMEFDNFLAYTVWKVVHREGGPWNLREDGWPRYPSDQEIDDVREWTLKKFEALCSANGYEISPSKTENNAVTDVRFKHTLDATALFAQTINRPLIPTVIRSRSTATRRRENMARQLYLQLRLGRITPEFESTESSLTSQEFTTECAIKSMYDWRATLQFLSRTWIDRKKNRLYVSREADESVIDSFNVHITRDRQINLGHKMLAQLTGPMRLRTLLTTNFDKLIEKAFARLLIPLATIPVSIKGGLPSSQTVRSQNTLVKLHGDSIETRADFSLDDEPSKADKESFARYVRGEFDESEATAAIPNHLIVMGFSGNDMRVIKMMKYLLDTRANVHIYWICYGAWEVDYVKKLFGDEYFSIESRENSSGVDSVAPPQDRLSFHATKRPDLFLYELYQELTLCLPSGGFSYEFTHKVPPEPIRDELLVDPSSNPSVGICTSIEEEVKQKRARRRVIAKQIGNHIADSILNDAQVEGKVFPFTPPGPCAQISWEAKIGIEEFAESPQGKSAILHSNSGGATATREAFQKLTQQNVYCLWLELQDYNSAACLAQDILRIMALRTGHFQLEHVVLFPGFCDNSSALSDHDCREEEIKRLEPHFRQLMQTLGVSRKRWTLFIYGSDVPGSCAGWDDEPWQPDEYYKLEVLRKLLALCAIHVVYVPYSKLRNKSDKEKLNRSTYNDELEQRISALFLPTQKECEDAKVRAEQQKSKAATDDDEGTENEDECLRIDEMWKESSDPHNKREPIDKLERAIDGKLEKDVNLVKSPYSYHHQILQSTMEAWLSPRKLKSRYKSSQLSNAQLYQSYLRRLRFLYAATLFRQSRHASAFFSDAVYSCSRRFNLVGDDNDWIRADEVREWIHELGQQDVFFYKPGGYSWKYRDIRYGLRRTLEVLPMFRFSKQAAAIFNVDFVEKDVFDFFLQCRARSHFWIGDWYFKAFCATGHYLPIVESLFHRFESIRNARHAKPTSLQYTVKDDQEKLASYRIVLARSALMEMLKTFKIARPWIKFWLSDVSGFPMFDTQNFDMKVPIAFLRDSALKNSQEHDRSVKELEHIAKTVQSELANMQQSLFGEAGNLEGKKWHRIDMPVAIVVKNTLDDLPSISTSYEQEIYRPDFYHNIASWLNELGVNELGTKELGTKEPGAEKLHEILVQYQKTGDAKKTDDDLKKFKIEWIKGNLKKTQIDAPPVSQDNVTLLRLLEVVADYVYVSIKRARLETTARGGLSNSSRRRWGQATILCFFGIDMCKHLHPAYLSKEIKLKVKLHTLYGLALAHLDRPFESYRHFNEASALLSKANRTLDEVELAIIRLRRAEAHLVRASRIGSLLDSIPFRGADVFQLDRPEQAEQLARLCHHQNEGFKQSLEQALSELSDSWKGNTRPRTSPTWLETNLYNQLKSNCVLSGTTTKQYFCSGGDSPSANVVNQLIETIEAKLLRELCNGDPSDEDINFHLESLKKRDAREKKTKSRTSRETNPEFREGLHVAMDPIILEAVELSKKSADEMWTANPNADRADVLGCFRSSLLTRLKRIHSATVDDAWINLESAEPLIAGYSHSSLWWGKLAGLRLDVYAQIRPDAEFESLVFRRKVQHDEQIRQLRNRLLLIYPSNNYQRLRAIDRVSAAMRALSTQTATTIEQFPDKDWQDLDNVFDTAKKNYSQKFGGTQENQTLLVQYLNRVRNNLDRRKEEVSKSSCP